MKIYYKNRQVMEIDYIKLSEVPEAVQSIIGGEVDPNEIFVDKKNYKDAVREQKIQNQKDLCKDFIYSHYPQSKQASDVADKNYYETMLKAKGVKNLEADIVSRAKRFFEGESLEEVVADVADADKEAYVQLLKVAIRVEWVQQCKAELKAAMKEEREPNFPDYPL